MAVRVQQRVRNQRDAARGRADRYQLQPRDARRGCRLRRQRHRQLSRDRQCHPARRRRRRRWRRLRSAAGRARRSNRPVRLVRRRRRLDAALARSRDPAESVGVRGRTRRARRRDRSVLRARANRAVAARSARPRARPAGAPPARSERSPLPDGHARLPGRDRHRSAPRLLLRTLCRVGAGNSQCLVARPGRVPRCAALPRRYNPRRHRGAPA